MSADDKVIEFMQTEIRELTGQVRELREDIHDIQSEFRIWKWGFAGIGAVIAIALREGIPMLFHMWQHMEGGGG